MLLLFISYSKARRIVNRRCTGKLIKFSSPYGYLAHVTGLIDRIGYLEQIGRFTCASESILVEYWLRSFSPWLASVSLDAAVGGDVVQDPAQVNFIISKSPYSTKPTRGIDEAHCNVLSTSRSHRRRRAAKLAAAATLPPPSCRCRANAAAATAALLVAASLTPFPS